MEVKKKENREIEVIADIICDSCGNSCKTEVDYEYMTLEANWGYGTKKDMERWNAQICEKCVDEKFSFIKFKISEVHFQTVLGTEEDMVKKYNNHFLRYPKNEEEDNNDNTGTQ